jgi:DNA topoisomerase-1
MKLVIVESPAKCGKIASFLGAAYKVHATMGHIRALEESLDSVGIERNWEPKYEEIVGKREAIAKLRSAAKGCDEIILASDDDREGEGIAWHVCAILKLDPATTPRIVFHEITKPAILAAVAAPRRLDMNKVNAQQARAMLDLLVGFTISKVLWNCVGPKLSAGRCQTPALRLVVERDAEVENHTASAYWRLNGTVAPPKHPTLLLEMQAAEDLTTGEEALEVLRINHGSTAATVQTVKESVSTSAPPKPYITSTLQQDASSLHGLGPKVTMQAAQKLYEAGHITYMRTDNPQLSVEAATAIRAYVTEKYGAEYIGAEGQHTISPKSETEIAAPEEKPKKKGKKAKAKEDAAPAPPEAQAAHEAIRPTHPENPEPAIEDATQKTVYRLIWRRATQSQMSPSETDVRKVVLTLDAEPTRVWNAEQSKVKFSGWKILDTADPEKAAVAETAWATWAPFLKPAAKVAWTTLKADEHFTKPKGRYTEASLIAELEKKGIGRPSTFASLVSTILDRDYVEKTNVEGTTQDSCHYTLKPSAWPPTASLQSHKVGAEKNKLRSTALGRSVSAFLTKEYSDLFNYDFTAAMESDLDAISCGEKSWKALLQTTWDTYKERYTAMSASTAESRAAARAAKERILTDGVKVILSRKGPLFVKDPPAGSPKTTKATFAALPPGKAFESVTAADAEAAFAAAAESRAGELVGNLGADEIRKKKGPYGLYAECKGVRVPLKGDEDLTRIQEKLTAKISFAAASDGKAAYERKVGDFTIKKGPYGLYFYKHTLKRVTFVKFPEGGVDPDKVSVGDLSALYSAGAAKKRRGPFKKKGTEES